MNPDDTIQVCDFTVTCCPEQAELIDFSAGNVIIAKP